MWYNNSWNQKLQEIIKQWSEKFIYTESNVGLAGRERNDDSRIRARNKRTRNGRKRILKLIILTRLKEGLERVRPSVHAALFCRRSTFARLHWQLFSAVLFLRSLLIKGKIIAEMQFKSARCYPQDFPARTFQSVTNELEVSFAEKTVFWSNECVKSIGLFEVNGLYG